MASSNRTRRISSHSDADEVILLSANSPADRLTNKADENKRRNQKRALVGDGSGQERSPLLVRSMQEATNAKDKAQPAAKRPRHSPVQVCAVVWLDTQRECMHVSDILC
jgi:hypothetical protein